MFLSEKTLRQARCFNSLKYHFNSCEYRLNAHEYHFNTHKYPFYAQEHYLNTHQKKRSQLTEGYALLMSAVKDCESIEKHLNQ